MHRLRERRILRAHGDHGGAHHLQGDSRGSALRAHACDPEDVRRAGKGKKIKLVGPRRTARRPARWCSASMISGKSPMNWARCSWWIPWRRWPAFPSNVDAQRIDICFSGTQKAISAPPGMAPITVNSRVEDVMHARKEPVKSWYFDLNPTMTLLGQRAHLSSHAADHSDLWLARGVAARAGRRTRSALGAASAESAGADCGSRSAGSGTAGFQPGGPPGYRDRREGSRATWTTRKVRRQLLDEFNIEIAGGFGPLKGKLVADRPDGLFEPEEQRAAVSRRAGEGAARSGLSGSRGRRSCGGHSHVPAVHAARGSGRKEITDVAKTLYPTIPNAGAMSEFIGAFDVPSKVTDYLYRCQFSHCFNGIATRHSDTMDCKFVVDGKGVLLGLAHPGFVAFREQSGPESVGPRSELHRRRISAGTAGAGRRALALRCFGGRCSTDHREAANRIASAKITPRQNRSRSLTSFRMTSVLFSAARQ